MTWYDEHSFDHECDIEMSVGASDAAPSATTWACGYPCPICAGSASSCQMESGHATSHHCQEGHSWG